MTSRKAPTFSTSGQAARIANALREADYTQSGIAQLLAFSGMTPPVERLDELRQRTRGPSAQSLHTRLWFLGDSVSLKAARHCVPDLEAWVRAGLLRVDGDRAHPLVAIAARQDLYVVADRPAEVREGAPADHVMGPAQSTVLIDRAITEEPMSRVLDLGTGSGFLALRAAARADGVIATDLNARAVAMTRFNSQLNGVVNIEARHGSLYEPVAGCHFDLIVSSPPYVISPGSKLMFCESDWRGDVFCRKLLRQAAEHLVEGGLCQIVCNWPHRDSESWQEAIEPWFTNIGCDAMVLGGNTQDAADYATNWIRDTRPRDASSPEREHPLWMEYFGAQGIERISYGVVTLRRRSGRNWVLCETSPEQFGMRSGDDIVRRMQLKDYLDATSDASLLNEHIVVVPGLQIEVPNAAGARRTVRRRQGLIDSVVVDANVAGLIERCTTGRALRLTLEEVAGDLDLPFEQFAPIALDTVRGLISKGILEPDHEPQAA